MDGIVTVGDGSIYNFLDLVCMNVATVESPSSATHRAVGDREAV